jgi:glycosyltransferase involved in cell wall biosynthesis
MSKAIVFSIVVPCFNEELAIPRFLDELTLFKANFSVQFPQTKLEVIFVNNNSTDLSKDLLLKYTNKHLEVKVLDCAKQGYGAALKYGFSSSLSDYYSFLDLDNTYPLDTLYNAFKIISENGSIDMLMTNRFSKLSKMPLIRSFGNHFFAQLVSLLFRTQINDACSGMRIIHSQRIQEVIGLSCDGLDFSIQLTCVSLKKKWSIHYLDMLYNQRDGVSKLSIVKDGLLFLKAVLKTKFQD